MVKAFLLMMALVTQPEEICEPTIDVIVLLSFTWGEVIVDRDTSPETYEMQLWANEKTGTWTIVSQHDSGVSCGHKAGVGYDGQTLKTILSEPT